MVDFSLITGFIWDKGNLTKNWSSHKVLSSEAEEAFFNQPLKIFPDFKHTLSGEDRFQALGKTNQGRLMNIIFTVRQNKFRVISARDMSKKERIRYHEK
jgi:hypothetical protein